MALRAAFIGLGNLGRPMAERLVGAGVETTVFDVDAAAVAALAQAGARAATSAREAATRADVVGVCVRDDAQVREAVLGEAGALAGARGGALLVLHSTILPGTVQELGRAAAERDVHVVDAPVTGAATGARAGKLCAMLGGEPADVERAQPYLECFASRIVPTGALGSGAATKLCNNLMTYLGFLAAFEANQLAGAAGLEPERLDAVLRHNGNLSDQRAAFLGLHRAGIDPGDAAFRAALGRFAALAEKDLDVTLAFARECGVSLPGTDACRKLVLRFYGLEDAGGSASGGS